MCLIVWFFFSREQLTLTIPGTSTEHLYIYSTCALRQIYVVAIALTKSKSSKSGSAKKCFETELSYWSNVRRGGVRYRYRDGPTTGKHPNRVELKGWGEARAWDRDVAGCCNRAPTEERGWATKEVVLQQNANAKGGRSQGTTLTVGTMAGADHPNNE